MGKKKRERQAGKASDGKSPTIFYFLRKNLVNGIIQKSKNLQFYFSGRCGKRLCCVFFTTRIHAHSTQNYKLLETIMCTFFSFFIMAFNSYMRVADFAFLRFHLWEFSFFVYASFFLYSLLYKSSRHNHRIYVMYVYITLMLFNKVLSFISDD